MPSLSTAGPHKATQPRRESAPWKRFTAQFWVGDGEGCPDAGRGVGDRLTVEPLRAANAPVCRLLINVTSSTVASQPNLSTTAPVLAVHAWLAARRMVKVPADRWRPEISINRGELPPAAPAGSFDQPPHRRLPKIFCGQSANVARLTRSAWTLLDRKRRLLDVAWRRHGVTRFLLPVAAELSSPSSIAGRDPLMNRDLIDELFVWIPTSRDGNTTRRRAQSRVICSAPQPLAHSRARLSIPKSTPRGHVLAWIAG